MAVRVSGASAKSVLGRLFNTPLIRIRNIGKEFPGVELWAKAEWFNPGGSVKDRPAYWMVREAVRRGELTPDKILLDSTSGNTGISYALLGAVLGYRVKLVMPNNASEKKKIILAYGAETVLTDPLLGSDGAMVEAKRIYDAEPGRYFMPDQYSNPHNPLAHEMTTAPEIWKQTRGRVTHFVAGMGTSGTVMGTGRGLKKFRKSIRVVAVEPDNAARYWHSSEPAGVEAYAVRNRFFAAMHAAVPAVPEYAVGPRIPTLFAAHGVEPIEVRLFPVPRVHLGAPPDAVWDERHRAIDREIELADSPAVVRAGLDYRQALDAYERAARAAGAGFVEIQHATVFATVGQKGE